MKAMAWIVASAICWLAVIGAIVVGNIIDHLVRAALR